MELARRKHQLHRLQPSKEEGPYSGGTQGLLDAERAQASFDTEQMIFVLDGGSKQTRRRRFIMGTQKGLEMPDKYNWSRPEYLQRHLKDFYAIHKRFMGKWKPTRDDIVWMSETAMNTGPMWNTLGPSLLTIRAMASEEQHRRWLHGLITMRYIVTYAQTELGHGSNVRALRTEAVYDPEREEFVLNTPTLQSLKWWPGALGLVATHALVYAQLFVPDGSGGRKHCGLQVFLVQLRDEEHRWLPGVETGDLGVKMGDMASDTGFMRLTDVRIPRFNMLNRHQTVSPDGKFSIVQGAGDSKMHYASMMFTRGNLVKQAGAALARAATIAVRYSCVRRQGFKNMKESFKNFRSDEYLLIDHGVQRFQLTALTALAYSIKITGRWMVDKFSAMEGGEASGAMQASAEDIGWLGPTSAGLKAVCTVLACDGIEECRRCCGGNGFLLSSGVSALLLDQLWWITAEGDRVVLALQLARYLVKAVRAARADGKPLSPVVDYVAKAFAASASSATAGGGGGGGGKSFDLNTLDGLLGAFHQRAVNSIALAEARDRRDGWERSAVSQQKAAQHHVEYFMLERFIDFVRNCRTEDPKAENGVRSVLQRLCFIFGFSRFLLGTGWTGVVSPEQLAEVETLLLPKLEAEVRPDLVSLVDAFDFPDRVLNSTIGRRDGNVYEALFESAALSPYNRRHPDEPFPGYEELLRPHLDRKFLAEGAKDQKARSRL